MKEYVFTLLLVAAAAGCNRETDGADLTPQNQTSDEVAARGAAPDTPQSPEDRTAERNKAGALTATDQSESDGDIKITKDIRQALVDHKDLSMSSKNAQVITQGGKVTLRGTVPDARERALIESAAKGRAGVNSVDNQLELDD